MRAEAAVPNPDRLLGRQSRRHQSVRPAVDRERGDRQRLDAEAGAEQANSGDARQPASQRLPNAAVMSDDRRPADAPEDMEDYLILGACNPPLAHRALQTDRRVGLLLPCNVVVRGEGAQTIVEALDPEVMVSVTGNDELGPVAAEAAARLRDALATLRNQADDPGPEG